MTGKEQIQIIFKLMHADVSSESIDELTSRNKAQMNEKAIALVRVSTLIQDLDQQREAVIKEMHDDGYTDENIICIEDKESAVKLDEEQRLGLTKMKELILADPSINCVYTYEVSRISRISEVNMSIRKFLRVHKVQLIIINPYIKCFKPDWTPDPNSNLLFSFFTAYAENEGYLRKLRTQRGIAARKAQGKYYGGRVLLGYTVDKDNYYRPDPVESQWIYRLFDRYANTDTTFRKLAADLIAEGWKSSAQPRSFPHIISEIIHDKRYCGADKAFPALVSEELFQKCQEKCEANITIQRTPNKAEMLCKGLLKCEEGYGLMCSPAGHKYTTHAGYGSISIMQHLIDPFIWTVTKQLFDRHLADDDSVMQTYLDKVHQETARFSTAQAKIKEVQEQIDRLEVRRILGKASAATLDDLSANLESQLTRYMNQEVDANNNIQNLWQKMRELKSAVKVDLDEMTFKERYDTVRKVIDHVVVTRPSPKKRMFQLHVYPKVGNKSLVYNILSDSGVWKLIQKPSR